MQTLFKGSLFCSEQLKPYDRIQGGNITQDMTASGGLEIDQPGMPSGIDKEVVMV